MLIDGEETAPWQLDAGVPQCSLLSPIFFLLCNALLLEELDLLELHLSALSFADKSTC
jgi:hypothetical protein